MKKDNLHSELAKAKGLGAAGNGTSTWWVQRVSAVALIPLVLWFVYFLLEVIEFRDIDKVESIFTSPFSTMFLALFIGVGIYHGCIGMKEIIEDYVHCNFMKISLIIFIKIFSLITAIAGICAVLVFHLSTFMFN